MSHSATVDIKLHVGNETLEVSQVGDCFLKLRDKVVPPNGKAELELVIDGEAKRYPIRILWTTVSRLVHFKDQPSSG